MKVLMLTWEYPPKTVGGLARHVAGLSEALAEKDLNVNVVTLGSEEKGLIQNKKGLQIFQTIPYSLAIKNFIFDIHHLNFSFLEKAVEIINDEERIDLIHAHDWLTAFAARALKHIYRIPLVATIHATEFGRNGGLQNDLQRYISSVEWWLTYEAWKVIVCSENMKNEISYIFQTPEDKIEVINNGINMKEFVDEKIKFERIRYALPNEKIIFFIGRLVPEKGVQVLLEAAPKILTIEPDAKFIIAGKGPYEEHLKNLVSSLNLQEKVEFVGFIEDEERNALYKYAHAVVFPSTYEPFGIVALEGMAAGVPVVASNIGGLAEIIVHEENGLSFLVGNSNSLADQVSRLLSDKSLSERISRKAREEVEEKYSWSSIANKTLNIYQKVIKDSKEINWERSWNSLSFKQDIPGRYCNESSNNGWR